jgi:hypothetical protein
MNVHRLPALCVALLSMAACESEVTAPSETLPASYGISQAPRIASGSGHVPFASGLREFTFHAVQAPDGTVQGSYKIELTSLGLYFTVDVSCMAIEGNTAWVAGHISDTNAGFIQVGTVSYFYAIDNGEGADATDVVSTARINDIAGEDQLFCADRPLLLDSFPIEQGNVQIR